MLKSKEILEEWKSINGNNNYLTDMADFYIPEGYFDQLTVAILTKIKPSPASETEAELQGVAPLLAKISRRNVFELPKGYFDGNNFSAGILQTVAENKESLSFPNELKLRMPYDVPEGYFDSLPDKILQKTGNKTKAIPLRIFLIRSWKYAAAALIVILIALSVTLHIRQQHHTFAYQLAQLPANDIEQYLENQTDVLNRDVIYNNIDSTAKINIVDNDISTADIQQYLDSQPQTTTNN
jgi:hypothetical protein